MTHEPLPKLHLNCNFNEWQNEKKWHLTDDYARYLLGISNIEDSQCCFCGAKDGKYLELHHKDGNHDNYEMDNLDTICALCHRSLHLGWACIDNCATLYFVPNDNARNLKELDLAFYNIISRLYLFNHLFQKNNSLNSNPKFLELWVQEQWLKNKDYRQPINMYLSLYDMLSHLQDNPDEQQEFLDKQISGEKGLFLLKFNTLAFKPLHTLPYTYSERINHLRQDKSYNGESFDNLVAKTIDALKARNFKIENHGLVFDKSVFGKKIENAQIVSDKADTEASNSDNEPSTSDE